MLAKNVCKLESDIFGKYFPPFETPFPSPPLNPAISTVYTAPTTFFALMTQSLVFSPTAPYTPLSIQTTNSIALFHELQHSNLTGSSAPAGTPAVNRTPIAATRMSLHRQRSRPDSYAASTATKRSCLPQRSRSFSRCYAVAGIHAQPQTARPIYRDELTDPAHIGSSTLSQLVVQVSLAAFLHVE